MFPFSFPRRLTHPSVPDPASQLSPRSRRRISQEIKEFRAAAPPALSLCPAVHPGSAGRRGPFKARVAVPRCACAGPGRRRTPVRAPAVPAWCGGCRGVPQPGHGGGAGAGRLPRGSGGRPVPGAPRTPAERGGARPRAGLPQRAGAWRTSSLRVKRPEGGGEAGTAGPRSPAEPAPAPGRSPQGRWAAARAGGGGAPPAAVRGGRVGRAARPRRCLLGPLSAAWLAGGERVLRVTRLILPSELRRMQFLLVGKTQVTVGLVLPER